MIYIYFLKFFFIFIPSLTLNATEKITDLLVADHDQEIQKQISKLKNTKN